MLENRKKCDMKIYAFDKKEIIQLVGNCLYSLAIRSSYNLSSDKWRSVSKCIEIHIYEPFQPFR